MTRKPKLDLYDLLRTNFGNDTAEPGRPSEADRRTSPLGNAKTASPSRHEPSRTGPVAVRRADPRAWKVAQDAVDGDASRLEILADGSVIIHNHPIR